MPASRPDASDSHPDREQVTSDLPNESAPRSAEPAATRRYTLGELVVFLDGLERSCEAQRASQQEQSRRDPIGAALNATYAAALRWQPDDRETPGIHRFEVLCDLEPGEAGINAAKVRRLRARICQQQRWRPPHADQLTLDEAADLLEGVQRVTLDEMQAVGQQQLHHGLATLDYIVVGPDEQVQVTGLSCKVVPGSVPTACPDANPVLPPSMVPLAEQAIRRLYPLPAGMTVHWVGHDTGRRSRCRCHPHAPFAAPFDRPRWVAVARPDGQAPAEASRLPDASQPDPPAQAPAPQSGLFTVSDIRDLLIYQARLVGHRAGLKSLNPYKVLATAMLPDLAPMQTAEVVTAVTPPEAPRLTEDAAWALATYRRIAASARADNRGRPDESDLMQLVGSVAARAGRAMAELLQMRDGDFDALAEGRGLPVAAGTSPPASGTTIAGGRPAEVSTLGVVCLRDHIGQAHAVPLAGCVYAGRAGRPAYLAQARERLCSEWIAGRLTAGRELELWTDPHGIWFVLDRACGEAEVINGDQLRDLRPHPIVTTTTASPAPAVALAPAAPAIDQAELAVLSVLRSKHPLLMKNVDIEAAAELSKQKVGEVVTGLIDKGLAARPAGGRKGVGLTPNGVVLVDRVRNSSADHP